MPTHLTFSASLSHSISSLYKLPDAFKPKTETYKKQTERRSWSPCCKKKRTNLFHISFRVCQERIFYLKTKDNRMSNSLTLNIHGISLLFAWMTSEANTGDTENSSSLHTKMNFWKTNVDQCEWKATSRPNSDTESNFPEKVGSGKRKMTIYFTTV